VFNVHVPSNALPKQTAPAASQTARVTKEVLDIMGADEAGICHWRQSFLLTARASRHYFAGKSSRAFFFFEMISLPRVHNARSSEITEHGSGIGAVDHWQPSDVMF
jgi:hypothetical protein